MSKPQSSGINKKVENGGRGGISSISKATSEQKTKMNRLIKRNEKYNKEYTGKQEYSKPVFNMNKDGSVSYDYTLKRIVHYEHVQKMYSTGSSDVYERTEYYSGKIMKDGLIKKNKKSYNDVLIKRGKRR